MKRAALVAGLVAALLGTAPAAAQTGDYTPVVGGGSFNSAPILEPGRYRDTVLPEEYLYYGVRVQAGQRLHIVGNVELPAGYLLDLGVPFVAINVEAPDRTILVADGKTNMDAEDLKRADFTAPSATTGAAAVRSSEVSWTGPGVYYVSVYAPFSSSGDVPKVELPFHFELAVEGAAVPEPASTPVATPTPRATASARPTPAATPAAGGGASAGVVAGFGVGALLIGALGGVVLRRRR
jgi:Ca-activated chloride channel family protein